MDAAFNVSGLWNPYRSWPDEPLESLEDVLVDIFSQIPQIELPKHLIIRSEFTVLFAQGFDNSRFGLEERFGRIPEDIGTFRGLFHADAVEGVGRKGLGIAVNEKRPEPLVEPRIVARNPSGLG